MFYNGMKEYKDAHNDSADHQIFTILKLEGLLGAGKLAHRPNLPAYCFHK